MAWVFSCGGVWTLSVLKAPVFASALGLRPRIGVVAWGLEFRGLVYKV